MVVVKVFLEMSDIDHSSEVAGVKECFLKAYCLCRLDAAEEQAVEAMSRCPDLALEMVSETVLLNATLVPKVLLTEG